MPVIRIAEIPNAGPRAVGASSANIGVPQFGGMVVNPQVAQLDGAAALSDTSIRRGAQSMLDQTLEQDAFTAEAEAGMRLGQSIGQLGQVAEQVAEKFGKAKDTADLLRSETIMRAAFEKQQNEQLDLPVEQWNENWERNLELARKSISEIKLSNNAAAELMPSWERWSGLSSIQIQGQSRKKQLEGFRMDLEANVTMKMASDDIAGAVSAIRRGVRDQILSEEEGNMMEAKLADDQYRMAKEQNMNRLVGEMNANPRKLKPLLERRSKGEEVPELGEISVVQAATLLNNTDNVIREEIANISDDLDSKILRGEITKPEEIDAWAPYMSPRQIEQHKAALQTKWENSPEAWARVVALRPKLLTEIANYDRAKDDQQLTRYLELKDTVRQQLPPGERGEFLDLLGDKFREGQTLPQPVRDALSTLSTMSDKGYFGAVDEKKLGSSDEATRTAEAQKLIDIGAKHMEKRQLLEEWAKENPAKAKDPEQVRDYLRRMMNPETTDKAIDIFNNTVIQSENERAAADMLDFPMQGQIPTFGVPSQEPGPVKTSGGTGSLKRQPGVNPNVYTLWDSVAAQYPSVENWGIWGDEAHKRRKSDHNTGDAIDIAIKDNNGDDVAGLVVAQAAANNVKYVIHNRRIWKPSTGWQPYKGSHAHPDHVHVSFNRGAAGPMVASN